jgi:hypothetical protein
VKAAVFLLGLLLSPDSKARSPVYGFAGFFAGFLLMSFCAAFALHFGVEKPFLLLKEQWSRQGPPVENDQPRPQLPPGPQHTKLFPVPEIDRS